MASASTSSAANSLLEEVIHCVRHVKHKKLEGTLYVMTSRIGWMNASAQTFRVSVNYDEIRVQKISPDTKAKVQLQLVLHDDATETFEFSNPAGRSESVKDRDSVKTHLLNLMQKSRTKLVELERRARVLARDPRLFTLYRDLVTTDVLTPEEFWKYYSDEAQILENANAISAEGQQQSVGVSPGFLASIRPITDGTNTLRSTLTSDAIASIFSVFPNVRRKHQELVPAKMSEEEFWQVFFESPYLHRDAYVPASAVAAAAAAKSSNSNPNAPALTERAKRLMFEDAARADEREGQRSLKRTLLDSFANLSRANDADWHADAEQDTDGAQSHAQAKLTPAQMLAEQNRALIRRCNQYSTNIVKLVTQSNESLRDADAAASGAQNKPIDLDGDGDAETDADRDDAADRVLAAKRAKLNQLTTYSDLSNLAAEDNFHVFDSANQLRLNYVDAYRTGPVSAWQNSAAEASPTKSSRKAQKTSVHTAVSGWSRLRLPEPSRSSLPVFAALGSVTVSNLSSSFVKRDSAADEVWASFGTHGNQVRSELRSLYVVAFEMLTRFWRCFPLVDAALAERAQRTCAALRRFEQLKLDEFKSRWTAELAGSLHLRAQQSVTTVTAHLDRMLRTAFDKFEKWSIKQRQLAV